MGRNLICLGTFTLLMFGYGQSSWGQLVQVEPGYVKAPFVRIYKNPDGSSYVRAPFVGVYKPGYGPEVVESQIDAPMAPSEDSQPIMGWQTLRQMLVQGVTNLDRILNRSSTGPYWKEYLHTAELIQIVDTQVDTPPEADEVARLTEILAAYNSAMADNQFRAITRRRAFRTVYGVLSELVITPVQRQRQLLVVSSRQLDGALEQVNTGQTWQRYLSMPPSVVGYLVAGSDEPLPYDQSINVDELRQVLGRFDSASRNPNYQSIAGLAAFQETHRHLAEYISLLQQSDAPMPPTTSVPEELVLPAPNQ